MGHAVCLSFTPYTAAPTSEHPEMPASNLSVLQHPRRVWQADTASGELVVVDQLAPTAVAGLYVDAVTFGQLALATSPDGTTWTSYAGGTLTVPTDPTARGRRHGYVPLTGVATQFLRLTPTAIDGIPAVRWGVLALVPGLTTLTRNFDAPIDWVFEDPHTRVPYANRGFELHSDGGVGKHVAVLTGTWVRSLRGDVEAIQNVGIGNPWLLQETIGAVTRTWIVTQMADIQWREVSGTHFGFTLPIEEFA